MPVEGGSMPDSGRVDDSGRLTLFSSSSSYPPLAEKGEEGPLPTTVRTSLSGHFRRIDDSGLLGLPSMSILC